MSNVVRIAAQQQQPSKRACATCAYRPRSINGLGRCKATGYYVVLERSSSSRACGANGNLWEKAPARKGLITQIRNLLIGGW